MNRRIVHRTCVSVHRRETADGLGESRVERDRRFELLFC